MRIKTIEKILPLKKVYNILLKIIQPNNKISIKSISSNSHVLVVLIKPNQLLYIIRMSTNKEFIRTYLSVLILNLKKVDRDKLTRKTGSKVNTSIISSLFKLLNDQNKIGLKYHLKKIPGIKLKQNNTTIKVRKMETRIINKIFRVISNEFSYIDELLKFPFSITQKDGSFILWERLYHPFISQIEKNIKKLNNNTLKIFRNFDFALNKDFFPRIFDLVVVKKEVTDNIFKEEDYPHIKRKREINLFNQDEPTDLKMINLRMTFVYCSKSFNSLKLMDLLKLMDEVKNYSKKLKQRIRRCNKVELQIIIISFFGYEPNTFDYLRKHIYHETDYIIPIFVLPPSENLVWHNLKTYNGLSETEIQTKKKLKKLIKAGHKTYSSFNLKASKARNAKDQYEELKEVEKIANDDYELMKKWSNILRINTKNRNQNQSYIKNEIPDSSRNSINRTLKI